MNNFKDCLFYEEPLNRMIYNVRSYEHERYSETIDKVVLSHNDDKRIILLDKISTVSHYYDGKKYKERIDKVKKKIKKEIKKN